MLTKKGFYIFQVFEKICGALRDLVPFVQFKKRESTHGRVLLLVKLQAEASMHVFHVF